MSAQKTLFANTGETAGMVVLPKNVFEQFTNHEGEFKETPTIDVQALLNLYEAAHLRVHGEDILEEALNFTINHLESIVTKLSNNSLKVQVTEALSHPIRKTVPRVVARKYIYIYENIEAHDDLLLKFAKLDFNMLQKLHQRELSELTSWWKDLDLANRLPYVRDKIVESYLWMLGVYFEPRYSRARKTLIKVFKMISTNDDTFDAYPIYDELVLFTNAIQRQKQDKDPLAKQIWAKGIPFKVSFFMWKLFRKKQPLDDIILRFGLQTISRCSCCRVPKPETVDHLKGSARWKPTGDGKLSVWWRKESLAAWFTDGSFMGRLRLAGIVGIAATYGINTHTSCIRDGLPSGGQHAKRTSRTPMRLRKAVEEAQKKIRERQIEIKHCYREANAIDDALAKEATTMDGEKL
uniref:Germacrene A synthase-like n=1 Tax=Nicotiana tabacum TaxID=4097 RepID=A0A1S4BT32_TOBAC|nr:PREDICTED: germacrene A synthase-like [Nicotiana tabacum]